MTLKEWRERRGMTQTRLSELSGVSRISIVRYEHRVMDDRNITLENAQKLADALDCDPRDFLH